ncbi:kinesin-like protein 5 isoform X2 [Exaiptasia diaphana]|uniref:Kinesin motor domain-containing protein n=1 Tax=Exaiptasia diaphana TaxID=2652724 RepID=A0A913Y083_EXADI|nr:kinesin-like protein 5 isoform X2 [Exaiptasia diaphana]KXJ23526.1 Centromere-associated protein E [Exaiptasia diaphana]
MKDKKGSVKGKEEVDRIRVFVRIRPQNEEELRRGETIGFETIKERNEIVLFDGKERRFQFDGIFPGSSSNRKVYYQAGKPLVDAAFKGFNGTLMAYGQTGTGKTYTQMSNDGICILSVQKLFRRIQSDVFHEYKVYMSYLQIYQEKIFDLLNPNHKLEMVLREDPKKGVYVENLTEYVVRSAEEVMSLIKSGKKRLIFAETRMNRLSSRSHSVCQITVERSLSHDSPRQGNSTSTSNGQRQKFVASTPSRRTDTQGSPASGASKIPMPASSLPRSQGTSDHAAEGSKIPTPKRRLSDTPVPQRTGIPHPVSTPNIAILDELRSPVSGRGRASFMSSLQDFPKTNRMSFHDFTRTSSFTSTDSDLDSDVLGSDAESVESLRYAPLFDIGDETFEEEEDDDDDEKFLESIKIRDDVLTKGRVNICDLAGSERVKRAQVDGERLSELQHINLSLLELGNTIHALSEGNRTHIPFRNSTLTRLLQDSLGGNCKTIFVMCVSPCKADLNETRCTLEFGQRALKIKNTAYINMEVDFVKLAADLRRQLEAQELEIQTQKESFEKEVLRLHSDQLSKLAEKESQLEEQTYLAREEAEKLRLENECLQKLLEEERQRKSLLEKEQESLLEKSLHNDSHDDSMLCEHQKEIERLQQELKEEKRRSLLLEEREKSKIESLLEAEKQRIVEIQMSERQKFESELEEERKRIAEEMHREEKDFRDVFCQSPSEDVIDRGPQPAGPCIDSTSTETFYNVLLAEIMSLQLLYQMQDIADVCGGAAPRSTDSGWADYDDELLENMGINLLEKGGLILDSLRAVQSGDIVSIASVDSIRDALSFTFPPSPKISSCSTDGRPHIQSASHKVSRDLLSEIERKDKPLCTSSTSTIGSKVSSDFWADNNNLESGTSSSMGSYCDQEPLSPRHTRQTSDSGCEMSPVDPRLNLQKEMGGGSNVCVPLAEEDDEDLIDESIKQMQILKDKVSTLDMELARLKNELDRETVNFFSAVFLVDLNQGDEDSPRVMRYLFDCVRDKLCTEIASRGGSKEFGSEQELGLPLSVLEQAVNLLLVNKTVMSCILVLQNRARHNDDELEGESVSEMSATLVPEEVTKVDQGAQTDDHSKSIKHQIRKGLLNFTSRHRQCNEDTGTSTDPELKSLVNHRECQTSCDWTSPSSPGLSIDRNDGQASAADSQDQDPWSKSFEEIMSNDLTIDSEEPLRNMSRDPDGASAGSESRPNSSNRNNAENIDEQNQDSKILIESDEEEEIQAKTKRKRKKINLLSCIGSPSRVSFRKKLNKKKAEAKSEKNDNEN